MRIPLLVAAGALFANTAPSIAQDEARSSGFSVAPLVHAFLADGDRAIDDAAAFTFAAGFEADARWNFELNLFRGRFDGAGGRDLTLDAAGLNALRVFRRNALVAPYLLVGVGAQRAELESNESSTDAYGDAGGGLLMTFRRSRVDGRALSLRFDARGRYDHARGADHVDYLVGLGLQYAFGSSRIGRVAPPAPLPPPAPLASVPADEDRDGVPDPDDRCFGTPPGTAVDAEGCEVDADGDGVANTVDECPGAPPRGTRSDARGCELEQEIQLPLVTFEYGSDRLEPAAFATLDGAVATLRLNPDLHVEVAGHTDARGSDSFNLSLSQRRAEAVRRYLVEKGVTNVLTARGYGEREPIADNGTEAGRAGNRRVILRIVEVRP